MKKKNKTNKNKNMEIAKTITALERFVYSYDNGQL